MLSLLPLLLGVYLLSAAAPTLPPQHLLDFWEPETAAGRTYRFSRARSYMVLSDAPRGPTALKLKVESPPPLPARPLAVQFNQEQALVIAVGSEKRHVEALLPGVSNERQAGYLIGVATEMMYAPPDERALGLLFEDIWLEPLAQPIRLPWRAKHSAAVLLIVVGLTGTTVSAWMLRRQGRAWFTALLRPSSWPTIAIGGICLLYSSVLSYYSIVNHNLFRTGTYDLGLFDQGLWLISHGYYPYMTAAGVHVLGDHGAVLLYPLALLYLLWSNVHMLLIAQSVAIALGALPIYLIGQAHHQPALGVLVAAAYLLHPATQNMNLFDFHPDSVAGSATLFALWGIDRKRWPVVVGSILVVLAAKENMALTIAMLGFWLVGHRQWRLGGLIAVLSVMWAIVITKLVVAPLYPGQNAAYLSRFAAYGGSMSEILSTFLFRPSVVLSDVLSPTHLSYVWQLLLPFAFLSLLSPRYLVLALPVLALNLLSGFAPQHSVAYHYNAVLVPFLALAALFGLLWLCEHVRHSRLIGVVSGLVLVVAVVSAQSSTFLRIREIREQAAATPPHVLAQRYIISRIPDDAGVSASFWLQPHVAHRQQSFLFPNPFQRRDFMYPDGMLFSPEIDYITYDLRGPADYAPPAASRLKLLGALQQRGLYRELINLDGVVLLERTAAPLDKRCFGQAWSEPTCSVR